MSTISMFNPSNILAGLQPPPVVDFYELDPSAGSLPAGSVLGLVTETGKLKLCASTSAIAAEGDPEAASAPVADGSQEVFGILAEDVVIPDPPGDTGPTVPIYMNGEFNRDALKFGGEDTWETHRVSARKVGIFFREVLS